MKIQMVVGLLVIVLGIFAAYFAHSFKNSIEKMPRYYDRSYKVESMDEYDVRKKKLNARATYYLILGYGTILGGVVLFWRSTERLKDTSDY